MHNFSSSSSSVITTLLEIKVLCRYIFYSSRYKQFKCALKGAAVVLGPTVYLKYVFPGQKYIFSKPDVSKENNKIKRLETRQVVWSQYKKLLELLK